MKVVILVIGILSQIIHHEGFKHVDVIKVASLKVINYIIHSDILTILIKMVCFQLMICNLNYNRNLINTTVWCVFYEQHRLMCNLNYDIF